MEFTDYMIWKLVAFSVLAFVWGVFCGVKGWPLSGPPSQQQDQSGTVDAEPRGSATPD